MANCAKSGLWKKSFGANELITFQKLFRVYETVDTDFVFVDMDAFALAFMEDRAKARGFRTECKLCVG